MLTTRYTATASNNNNFIHRINSDNDTKLFTYLQKLHHMERNGVPPPSHNIFLVYNDRNIANRLNSVVTFG
jgi:hypothetical protein